MKHSVRKSLKKVLFTGLGSIGQRHVRNLRTLLKNEVEILAYRARNSSPVLNADFSIQKDGDMDSNYDIRSFTDLDEALNEKPVAVFITNPNTLHIPIALKAAEAGCHLFIEKPLSHSLDGVDELIEIVSEKNLTAFVAYQFRFHPGLKLIHSWIESGRFGQLTSAHIVNGEYMPDWHKYEDYRETHPARRDLGGGCLRIQTHELDYALWLFGMPQSVYALGGHLSHLEIDVEDTVDMMLSCYHNSRQFPVHVHLDYMQRPPQRVCEVVGDRGKAHYYYYQDQVIFHALSSSEPEIHSFNDFDRNQMFMDEISHFIDCIEGEVEPIVDLKIARQSMHIGLAAEKSLWSGNAEPIND